MKKAFTLIETLVSLAIISAVGMASTLFVSGYFKTTYERDMQTVSAINNLSAIEELKAGVDSLPRLYSFISGKEVKVTAIGVGEIDLHADGTYDVVAPESFGFSDSLLSDTPTLFRLDFGGDLPNTKMTAVVRIE